MARFLFTVSAKRQTPGHLTSEPGVSRKQLQSRKNKTKADNIISQAPGCGNVGQDQK